MSDQQQGRQPRVGHRIKATDGRFYEFYIDEYQRRWWRSVDDHNKLVPYNVIEATPTRKYEPPVDPWIAGLLSQRPFRLTKIPR